MLKKMRRRFVMGAMAAFGLVMLVLMAGINILNHYHMAAAQDRQISNLLEYMQAERERGTPLFPPLSDMPGVGGSEAEFTTRFFAVHCDTAGNVNIVFRDYISSVDDGQARTYAEKIREQKRSAGYYKDYRYQVREDDTGSIVLFLNVSRDLEFAGTLLVSSVVTGIVSLLTIFVLVMFFSKRAIEPYARNIERQKRFITDAGHEIKTPLTSIATSADIAAMEYEGDEWIENIQKQAVRMTKLVSELVELSRLDEERPFPEKTVFCLSDAAWEAAEPFAALCRAGGKRYSQEIQEQLSFRGDRGAVQQLISILLDNAVRYSDAGGEIRLRVYRRLGHICIEVFNTCALKEIRELDRLFDRFYRPDESRSKYTGGTGIGLSMARAIAEAHGGKIRAKSADGRTILFRATL